LVTDIYQTLKGRTLLRIVGIEKRELKEGSMSTHPVKCLRAPEFLKQDFKSLKPFLWSSQTTALKPTHPY